MYAKSKYIEMAEECRHERDLYPIIIAAIRDRWKTEYPQYAVYSENRDAKTRETALAGPSKFLTHILNAVERTDFTRGGYYVEDYYRTAKGMDTLSEGKRLVNDILTCTDLRIWLIEMIGG